MKTLIVIAIFACFAAAQLVQQCPTDGRLVKCSLESKPVCGVKQSAKKQKKETYANHCLACSLGKANYTVEGKCENYPKEAEFCSPAERDADACLEIYQPACGWYNQSIKCFAYPCAGTGSNRCEACRGKNVLYTTKGECPAVGSHP